MFDQAQQGTSKTAEGLEMTIQRGGCEFTQAE